MLSIAGKAVKTSKTLKFRQKHAKYDIKSETGHSLHPNYISTQKATTMFSTGGNNCQEVYMFLSSNLLDRPI